jgi:uncharacterized protein YecT (DUF1311 family)
MTRVLINRSGYCLEVFKKGIRPINQNIMCIKSFLLLILLFFVVNIAYSQNGGNSKDIAFTDCLNKPENQTTAGMCHCTYAALERWDKKLNTTYKSLLQRLDSSAKPKLIEAQRQWIKFKEKEIALIDATYGKADGTMSLVISADKVLQITKSRAEELLYLLDALDETKD